MGGLGDLFRSPNSCIIETLVADQEGTLKLSNPLILEMEKVRLREEKWITQCHALCQRQSWGSPSLLLCSPLFIFSLALFPKTLFSSGSSEFPVVSTRLHACPSCSLTTLLHYNPGLVSDEGVPVAGSPCLASMAHDRPQPSSQDRLGPALRLAGNSEHVPSLALGS